MSGQEHKVDVAIVGGGLVGMTLAVALAREGGAVSVIERQATELQLSDTFDGRVSAIALGSQRLLKHIGVWQHVVSDAEPIRDIRVSDGDAPFFLHYDSREVGADCFGYIVENRAIRAALIEEAKKHSMLRLHVPAGVRACERSDVGVRIELSTGEAITARLLIGADGKNSFLRKEAGIAALEWKYDHSAIVCTIAHEKPHEGLAQERFLPVGPFAVLPMTKNRSSLVWTEPNNRLHSYLELPDDEFNQEIAERVGDYLGKLHAVGPRYGYPLTMLHAQRYTAMRLALVGDAAHAIHPIAGQGVNLGYRDAAVLAELIGDAHRLGLDVGNAQILSRYERWRRFDNTTMMVVTDGLTKLFSNNLPPLKLARGLGLWAVGRMPPLKRFFMRHAMGVVGDVPRLMRADSEEAKAA